MTTTASPVASALPSVSVVICAYTADRWEHLERAVESVTRQTHAPREIMVVIDHNPSLYERAVLELPEATVLENVGGKGLSAACNTGVSAATGQIVAFIDDDAEASWDWLERLCAHYQDPDVIGVGGRIDPGWEDGIPPTFPDEFNWVVGCSYSGLPTEVSPVRNLVGCNMSFRREVFERVGGMNSSIGRSLEDAQGAKRRFRLQLPHCEETEFSVRIQQRIPGATLLYDPEASVNHLVPSSRGEWRYFSWRCFTEGLAKSAVVGLVGSRDGLKSEWSYTLWTLPAGVLRGIYNGFRTLSLVEFGKSAAITAGFCLTLAGYLTGHLAQRLNLLGNTQANRKIGINDQSRSGRETPD